MGQVTLYDIVVGKKDKESLIPPVWDCVKTCANYTNINPDGTPDYFFQSLKPRCVHMKLKSKLIKSNQTWKTICTNYKPKE